MIFRLVISFIAINPIQSPNILEYESEPEIDLSVEQQLECYLTHNKHSKPVIKTKQRNGAKPHKKTGIHFTLYIIYDLFRPTLYKIYIH